MEPDELTEERLLALLGVRLDQLISRRIPVRGVHAGPVERSTRLRFADGTTLLVRSDQAGGMARVLQAVTAGRPVLIERWERRASGLALWLAVQTSVRRLHLGVVLLGPDQPD